MRASRSAMLILLMCLSCLTSSCRKDSAHQAEVWLLNHGLVPVSVTDTPEATIGPFVCPDGYWSEKAVGRWPGTKTCPDQRSEFLLCCLAEEPTCVIRQQTDICVR